MKKDGTTTAVAIDLSQVQGPLTLSNIVTYVNASFRPTGSHPFPEDRNRRHRRPPTPTRPMDFRLYRAATSSFSVRALHAGALCGGQFGLGHRMTNTVTIHLPGPEHARRPVGPPDQAVARWQHAQRDFQRQPAGRHRHDHGGGHGGGFKRQRLCDRQRHRQSAATSSIRAARTSISPNMIPPAMCCGRSWWAAPAAPRGYGLALDPAGGVVVSGASTADLNTTSVANGNTDSFVASYDSNGNQNWIKQVQTLATNQANAVSVDASGNIYIGGSVSGGVIGAGQTAQGGGDAYLAKFNSTGTLVAENQFGTSPAPTGRGTATGSDGSLYVASVQNGEAIVAQICGRRYHLGADLDGRSGRAAGRRRHRRPRGVGQPGLRLRHHQQRQSDRRRRSHRHRASTGGTDAFVFSVTDNGTSAAAGYVPMWVPRPAIRAAR